MNVSYCQRVSLVRCSSARGSSGQRTTSGRRLLEEAGAGSGPRGLAQGLACHAAEDYCRCVIAAICAAGATLFVVAALVWTARLVHVGNLDALSLAQKVGTPHPISALDWPELHVGMVVSVTDEPPVVLLLVEWPAHPERTASLLVRLDHGDSGPCRCCRSGAPGWRRSRRPGARTAGSSFGGARAWIGSTGS
jgi:hypothetical protein